MNTVIYISIGFVTLAGGLVITRIVKGPHEPDRAIASDLLISVAMSLYLLYGIVQNFRSLLDVLIVVSSAAFLSTLALARLIMRDEQ